jgi:hypothetical protein
MCQTHLDCVRKFFPREQVSWSNAALRRFILLPIGKLLTMRWPVQTDNSNKCLTRREKENKFAVQ